MTIPPNFNCEMGFLVWSYPTSRVKLSPFPPSRQTIDPSFSKQPNPHVHNFQKVELTFYLEAALSSYMIIPPPTGTRCLRCLNGTVTAPLANDGGPRHVRKVTDKDSWLSHMRVTSCWEKFESLIKYSFHLQGSRQTPFPKLTLLTVHNTFFSQLSGVSRHWHDTSLKGEHSQGRKVCYILPVRWVYQEHRILSADVSSERYDSISTSILGSLNRIQDSEV
jgi:hypothetical protein